MKIHKKLISVIKKKLSCLASSDSVSFVCNVCGKRNTSSMDKLSREQPSCANCGSTVRMRAIVHILSMELFEKSIVLKDFPVCKDVKGVGMSDWDGYASVLAKKLGYTNTYYHQEPKLDITDISEHMYGTMNFIVSSDVFEHVLSPVSRAFDNVGKLLKDNGVFIFTVPYTKEGDSTVEHFEQLHDFQIVNNQGEFVLVDVDDSGNKKEYTNLIFHGGPGSTLEMRVFSEKSLVEELKKSGFKKIKIYNESYIEYGIHWDVDWSLPIAARM